METKLLSVVLCLSICIGFVLCEQCTTDDDCTSTQCASGNDVICQHPDGAGVSTNGGLCTCVASGGCVLPSDCAGSAANLNCPDNMRHCYDGNCICDRFVIGK